MTIKINIAIFVFAAMSFTACIKKDDTGRKVIDDHFKYADSALVISYIMPGYKHGPLGADEIYHYMFFISPDEQYRVDDIMTNDSATIVQYDVMGYRSMTNLKSGYSFRNCTIFKIKGGKITSEITYSGRTPDNPGH
jgi:hypothetical protein